MPQRTLSEQEFNAIRDRVLAAAPDGLSEADFQRYIGPAMAQAIGEAENLPPTPEGGAVGRFAAGAAEMLNPIEMVKGAAQAVRHPIQTGTAIVGAMGDQWSRAAEAAREGHYSEAVGHAVAGSIPLVGPAAAEIGERIGEGDIAGGLGTTAGLLTPFGVKPAVQGVRRAIPAGARQAAAGALEKGAANRVAGVMSPQVGPNKTRFGGMAEQVAPEIAANPQMGAWSRTGLQNQVEAGFDDAARALDDAADARLTARTFDTKAIVEALKTGRQKLVAEAVEGSRLVPTLRGPGGRPTPAGPTRNVQSGQMQQAPTKQGRPIGQDVEPAPSAARIAAIDQVISEIQQLGPVARYEPLRRIRAAWDQVAKQKYNPSMTADFMKKTGEASGAAEATGVLRQHLAKFEPATATANAQYSLMKTARDVLKATEEVERTRPRVGRQIMARLTATVGMGAAAGTPGAITGFLFGPAVEAALSAGVTTKIQTARLMSRLATAIRKGDVGHVTSLTSQLRRMAPTGAVLTERTTTAMAPVAAEDSTNAPATGAQR